MEQELAKKRGRQIEATDQVENELKRAEDELYKIPDHLKVITPPNKSKKDILQFYNY